MNLKFVTNEDLTEIGDFCAHHFRSHAGMPPGPIFHYTTGAKLIEILRNGNLWATQAGCLNDEKELLYSIELLHKRVKASLAARTYPKSELALRAIARLLDDPRPEVAGVFVTCFSENGDDLAQWRAYSGGESGYALKFDPQRLAKAGLTHQTLQTVLLRVEYYKPERHDILLDDIVKWTDEFYLRGIMRKRAPAPEEWAEEFAGVWLENLALFATYIKHPSFEGEREWRLVRWGFNKDIDYPRMKFVQRRSLISRHIALDYGEKDSRLHLPLTGVVVGPCRFKRASKVAVGDLLAANGYDPDREVIISETDIPYREV
jgi:Protein of unknown function (DUF2971)